MFSRRQLFLDHIAQTSLSPMMMEISSADGVFVYDTNGKKYFDLISGVNVSALGHGHPRIKEAVKAQAEKYLHVMVYGEFLQEPQLEYARLLTSYLPEKLSSVYFVNSGSEAIEGAIKLARKYTGRAEVLSFYNAYHGSTIGSLSIMGGEEFKQGYYPLVPGIRHLAFNDLEDLEKITSKTACVVAEVLQAEAGMVEPENGFMQALRDKCSSTGSLLVLDEIQTGFGRLGTLFGFERYGIVPDILVLAKSFGGGLPLGAFIAPREIMEVLSFHPPLGHITTFGGNPLCCAAGKACLETILDEELILSVNHKEELFRNSLLLPEGTQLRGTGLMLALEMGKKEKMMAVVQEGLKSGFITDWFLFCDTAFRISPPLNITDDEIAGVCGLLNEALRKFMA